MLMQGRLRVIQDHFERGGSTSAFVGVLCTMAALLGLLFLAYRVQQRRSSMVERSNPARVFRKLLGQLDLTVRRRDLLKRIAAAQTHGDALVMLLSRRAFDQQCAKWLRHEHDRGRADAREMQTPLAELSDALFGPVIPAEPAAPEPIPAADQGNTSTTNGL